MCNDTTTASAGDDKPPTSAGAWILIGVASTIVSNILWEAYKKRRAAAKA